VKDNERELRLALALRGGTSLAVWIGGAVSEINNLRRALGPAEPSDEETPEAEHPWAALARLAGYDAVTVDILAGASAGGLNATLMSASIVYGMPFDRMREMWVSVADAEALARPVPKFWNKRPPSLLEGDDYFRSEVESVLWGNIPRHHSHRLGDQVNLLLTATLLDAVQQRQYDQRSEPYTEQRRRAWFRFRHRGQPGMPLSDFGTGPELAPTIRRLAEAARTTASFPGAFEPASVHSSPQAPPSGAANLAGSFSETAPAGSPPYRVIDGGVLDNIPIDDAVRAIASAEASGPTQRWLLYLNPSPDVTPREPPKSQALPVVFSALRAKSDAEAFLADISALEEHNRVVERGALRRKALFAELRAAEKGQRRETLTKQTKAVLADHALVRAELDALAVHELFTDTHREDGLLLPPVVGDPLASWSAEARTALPERLSVFFAEWARSEPNAVFDDVRGLLSGVQECLGWARDIEESASRQSLEETGSCKTALYRLRLFGRVLEAHADRYWLDGARLEPIVELSELDGWVTRMARRAQRLQRNLPSPVEPLLGAMLSRVQDSDDERFQSELAGFAAELRSIEESSGADAVAEEGAADRNGVDAVSEAFTVLHRIASRLSYVATERTDSERPEAIGYGLLEQADDDDRPGVLRDLVVLTAPLDVGRSPGEVIKFLRIVSDEQSPLPFTALRDKPDGPLRAADKIRGLSLDEFGAFLSAKWRANDWMWGRLDATACLVRLLLDPKRLVRQNSDIGPGGLASALEAVVTTPTAAELGSLDERASQQWHTFLADLWSAHADEVLGELAALFRDPDGDHTLPRATQTVLERLQWTIAARELPYVTLVNEGADLMGGEKAPVPTPDTLAAEVPRYSVGKQRLSSLGEKRMATMGTRFGLIGFRALLPGGSGLKWLGKAAMLLLKPLVLAVVFAFTAPTRAATLAFLGTTAVALTGSQAAADSGKGWTTALDFSGVSFGPGVVVATVLSILSAGWLGWQLSNRIPRTVTVDRRVAAAVIAVVVLAVELWVYSTGFRLGPIGLAVVGVVLTWFATFVYRTPARGAAVVLTAAAFAVVTAVASPAGGGWILAVLILSAYLHMVLLGSVDVLPPRPRPRDSATKETPVQQAARTAVRPTEQSSAVS
jgi:patatin-related protein